MIPDLSIDYRRRRQARLAVKAQAAEAKRLASGELALAPLVLAPAVPPPEWLRWALVAAGVLTIGVIWSARRIG